MQHGWLITFKVSEMMHIIVKRGKEGHYIYTYLPAQLCSISIMLSSGLKASVSQTAALQTILGVGINL